MNQSIIIIIVIMFILIMTYSVENFRRHGGGRSGGGGRPGGRAPRIIRSSIRRPRRRYRNPIRRRSYWNNNSGWGWNVWRYLYPYNDYPYNYIPENPGCDGKSCGGYCNPFNSRCCGGTSPSTCGMPYCSGNSLCN